MSVLDRLMAIDRRFIYLLMALAVAGPVLFPVQLPVVVSKEVDSFHREIEALSPGDQIILAFDYEPDVMAELNPMAEAVIDRLFTRNVEVISLTLYPGGVGIAQRVIEEAAARHDKKNGEDYVFLGYNPDWSGTMLRLGESIKATYPADQFGRDTRELPILSDCDSYADVELLISICGSALTEYWAAYAKGRYGQRMVSGNTAVQAVLVYPFYQSGQISGFLGGLKGAAEYETLINRPSFGVRGMGSQSAGHLLIVLCVIMGNIGYLAGRRRRERQAADGEPGGGGPAGGGGPGGGGPAGDNRTGGDRA
jgi:hypothetical protein